MAFLPFEAGQKKGCPTVAHGSLSIRKKGDLQRAPVV
jgi:hypothetical protein